MKTSTATNAIATAVLIVLLFVTGGVLVSLFIPKPPETTPVEPEKPYAPLCPDVIPKPEPKPAPKPVKPKPTPNIIGPLKPTPSGPAVTAWELWMSEHSKTCPECGGFPDHGMCVEAFTKFQAALRADRPAEIPEPDPMPEVKPAEAEPQQTYRSAPRRRGLFQRIFGR